ncbi:MAG: hypothetical protein JWQ73_256 [Variovorax sp.]|nr:hypothetical protein [Variovorax sp.]
MNTATYAQADAPETSLQTPPRVARSTAWRRVSWGAIIAGVVIAMVLQLVLSLLGASLGLSTVDPASSGSPERATFAVAAGAWWVASSALALFAGGWVAAHLAGAPDKTDASLHGLLTWGLATVVMAAVAMSVVGSVVAGGGKLLGAAAAGASGTLADAVRSQTPADISIDNLKGQAQQRLAQAASPGASPVDPSAPLTEDQKAQAEAKARQLADHAARRASQAALAALLAMVIGAVAATFGGSLAGRRYWVANNNGRF